MTTQPASVPETFSDKRKLAVIPVSLALAVAALLLFAYLSEEVLHRGTEHFDQVIRSVVHAYASPGITEFMRFITNLGDWAVLLPGTILLWIFFVARGMRRHVRLLLITVSGALVLDAVLKLAVHRARPDPFFIAKPSTYSFPSGHALVSLCFYGVVAGMLSVHLRARWQRVVLWITAGLLIGTIGLSRIYLGVHWPSDVLAGYAAAIVWMGAIRVLVNRQGRAGLVAEE